MKTDYDALGLPYDPPAVRVDRFEEAVQVIKGCFTGEPFSVQGEHYRITDYASWPVPVQKPGPPILIGGGGKRVLSIAAREADIVGINPNLRAGEINADAARDSLKEQTDRKIQWVRDAAGVALGRHRDPDALLRREHHRRPHGHGRRARAGVRRRARSRARSRCRARRQRERGHRAAATAPRGVGPVATSCSATTTSTSSPRVVAKLAGT